MFFKLSFIIFPFLLFVQPHLTFQIMQGYTQHISTHQEWYNSLRPQSGLKHGFPKGEALRPGAGAEPLPAGGTALGERSLWYEDHGSTAWHDLGAAARAF